MHYVIKKHFHVYDYGPMKCLSKLRDIKEILPSLSHLSSYLFYLRRKLLMEFLVSNTEMIQNFINQINRKQIWANPHDLIILEDHVNAENFSITFSSKSLFSNIVNQFLHFCI